MATRLKGGLSSSGSFSSSSRMLALMRRESAMSCNSTELSCLLPPEPTTRKSSSKRRSSDIISLLVSIYGSKDLFINEYRTLLADRLLHQFNYSAEREIRNVELLKLRFGEAQMHYCEVMLKCRLFEPNGEGEGLEE
ncbi:hypothetical protein EK904_007169 [Melospiza melodia maxima]|nr:hypothetical protein EK904_007169 [Melospiza melodia maxima]